MIKFSKIALNIFLLAALNCFNLKAQDFDNIQKIEYINSDIGLSQNEVTSILKDKKGFIWIATRGGLNRYDGNNIKVFHNEIGNTNSLINNSIETLFEDSHGVIWIGTKSNGLSAYHPELNQFEQIKSNNPAIKLDDKRIISIAESSEHELWLGTWQNGLFIYNPKTKSVRKAGNLNKINDIYRTTEGNMWLATDYDLLIFDKNGNRVKRVALRDTPIEFTSVLQSETTGLGYIGTWREGLLEFNPKTETFTQYNGNGDKNLANAYFLCEDDKHNILIGTWGNGVHYFDTRSKTFSYLNLYTKNNKGGKELYQDVLCVFQDNLGILWFGTNGGGLCKLDKTKNDFEDTEDSNLPNEPIWAIAEDQDNQLWVGIKGNENLYYTENYKTFFKIPIPNVTPRRSSAMKDGIRTIYEDRNNNLWFANNSSLFKVEKSNSGYSVEPVLIRDDSGNSDYLIKITSLFQSRDGTFWIGTQQRGLRKSVNHGNPETQTFKSYLVNDRISKFLEDSKGRIWVGTYQGLKLYDKKADKFKVFTKVQGNPNSLSSDIVISIHEDADGTIWVGTPNGLNQVVESKEGEFAFKSFQEKDGLSNSYIHAILEDDQNNIWVSTNKGLVKFNKKDNSFYNFDINSGLLSNTFMEGAAIKGHQGKLFFGSIYGINYFKPKTIKSLNVPPVVLSALRVAGQEIIPGEIYNNQKILDKAIEYSPDITLKNSNNSFTIEYTALDFLSNLGYTYKYKLEGLDKDWNTTSTEKNITYSNLSAGNYTFKVKATNLEAGLESKPAFLRIKILPVFWKTWQALLIYIFIFIGLLYLYRYIITKQSDLKNKLALSRLERKKEEELIEMKTRFFTDIAHEFRTPLSLISGPLEVLMDDTADPKQKKGHLSTIYYHTQRLLNLVNQLLDFRKIDSGKMKLQVAKGNFKKFAKEIYLSFKELADSKKINFKFDVKASEIPLTYDRNMMEIVLCNLLSNAFKYTPKNGNITLSIQNIKSKKRNPKFPQGYCEIVVQDNGPGISKENLKLIFDRFYQTANTKTSNLIGTGIGLALVKSIVDLHKGKIKVKSELNKGSKFIVKLPLEEAHFTEKDFITDFKTAEDPVHYKVERVLEQDDESEIQADTFKKKLLIVEDNPEIRAFIKSVFNSNYQIFESPNGRIGFEKAQKHLPDLVISDLIMPEMDGLELCKKLRDTKETLHIPIIMLTARTKTVFQEQGYSSGADIYVTKPFNPTVLKAQAEGLLNNREKLKNYFSKKVTLQPTDTDITSFDEAFINSAMKVVEENLMNDDLNRDFLAEKMATSPSTLYRKIKSLTDQDTTEFIRSIRLKRAAQMILKKQDNIGSIGYAVGFNDLKYFRKCFKEQFGVTPSKFKKSN
ncbi:hybrid sensor histidine kinase/response regulator transcription factor [Gaetbulibacter aestuarii]|uniref:histidine kinase n=1 Tax=Gaetbulibacter aestuarii TaxID=1502358 RepID=A0ABW7MZV2_9FLAO